MATSTLHVIGPPGWVAGEFRRGLADLHGPADDRRADHDAATAGARIVTHDGLSPARGISDGDAVWSSPGTLISLNDWRRRSGLPPLRLAAPAADAIARLPYPLTRHPTLVVRAGDVLAGHAFPVFPSDLGERPWSRVASGRVAGFRAARRDWDVLRRDLAHAHAPDDSLIELAGNVEGLVEEWCVVIDPAGETAAACSGACVHPTPGRMDVVTVFDGACFDPGRRQAALDVAEAAAGALDVAGRDGSSNDRPHPSPPPMSLLLGFADGSPAPAVLEIDPVWCTTPYPFGREGMKAFVDAIGLCRMAPPPDTEEPRTGGHQADRDDAGGSYDERSHDDPFVWSPDPWMIREFSRRYRGFPPFNAGSRTGHQPGDQSDDPSGRRPPDTV
ncbi:hypothetical protein [uncultured Bifidobacterium sp.]|uniref:hypothetical protein n=1 Tax=uncultured Bifidobacterium sp. TaxID=165187 RepID=UPI0028DCD180|nr:hypothetical protein [uncultured Bifidobacterium sp.]